MAKKGILSYNPLDKKKIRRRGRHSKKKKPLKQNFFTEGICRG